MANSKDSKALTLSSEKREYLATTYKMQPEQIDVIRNVIALGANDTELEFFIATAHRLGLDPLAKQIWFVRRPKKIVQPDGREDWIHVGEPQTGIDGYRSVAERTSEYEGQGPMMWCGPDGNWRDVWVKSIKEPPLAAKATIYRKGFREALTAVAVFEEFKPRFKNGGSPPPWINSPSNQIAKCAESLAFRKAFPRVFSGVLTDVESERFDLDQQAAYSAPPPATASVQVAKDVTDKPAQLVDGAPANAKDVTAARDPNAPDDVERELIRMREVMSGARFKEDLNTIGAVILGAVNKIKANDPEVTERDKLVAALHGEVQARWRELPKKGNAK